MNYQGDSCELTQHTIIFIEDRKDFPKSFLFAFWSGTMINPQWLKLPMSRTNFYGPKNVWAIEDKLY